MLSQSSVEWIDEAMAHNNAHDGEVWMRQRTREAHQAYDTLPLWDVVDGFGNLVRHEQSAIPGLVSVGMLLLDSDGMLR